MKRPVLIFLFYFSVQPANSSFELKTVSARSQALSNAVIARPFDLSSSYLNLAGLGTISQIQYSSFYTQLFSMKELTQAGADFLIPSKKIGSFGFLYRWFGSSDYSEQEWICSHGFSLAPSFWVGYGLKTLHLKIDQFGGRTFFSGDAGALMKINKNLFIGAGVRNMDQPFSREFRIGTSFRPIHGLYWMVDFEQIAGRPLSFRTGTEFECAPYFFLRSGFQKNPLQFSGGFGVGASRAVQLDYAYRSHETLPDTHLFSLTLKFDRCW